MSKVDKSKDFQMTQRVDMDLLSRSIPGVFAYILIWPIIFLPSRLNEVAPYLVWSLAVMLVGASLLRLLHREFTQELYEKSSRIWLAAFSFLSFFQSAIFGWIFYLAILDQRFATAQLVCVLVLGGVASGVIVTLAPRIKLAVTNVSAILLPGIVASFVVEEPTFAALTFIYWIYLVLVALRIEKEYYRAFDIEIQLQEKQVELQRLNQIDPLTQIYNRGHFNTAIEHQWNVGVRSGKEQSLLLIDVDHFKAINDNHGHLLGDVCLAFIAEKISQAAKRKTDLIARYGGEEFAILLSDTGLKDALILAEYIRKNVAKEPFSYNDVELKVTASIGVACLKPLAEQSPNLLVDQADKALYLAKDAGRNQVCQFSE